MPPISNNGGRLARLSLNGEVPRRTVSPAGAAQSGSSTNVGRATPVQHRVDASTVANNPLAARAVDPNIDSITRSQSWYRNYEKRKAAGMLPQTPMVSTGDWNDAQPINRAVLQSSAANKLGWKTDGIVSTFASGNYGIDAAVAQDDPIHADPSVWSPYQKRAGAMRGFAGSAA